MNSLHSQNLNRLYEIHDKLGDIATTSDGKWKTYEDPGGNGRSRWLTLYEDMDGSAVIAENWTVEFPEHVHNSTEFIIILVGAVEIIYTDSGEVHTLEKLGTCRDLCIPPGQPHIARYSSYAKLFVTLVPTGDGF